MADQIQIIKSPTGWIARFTGPHAAEITELFGTDVIPTAFTAAADRSVVLAEVQRLNPNAFVFCWDDLT